ncbi:hypothetical protein ACJX0J_030661, partial [Zea mays]
EDGQLCLSTKEKCHLSLTIDLRRRKILSVRKTIAPKKRRNFTFLDIYVTYVYIDAGRIGSPLFIREKGEKMSSIVRASAPFAVNNIIVIVFHFVFYLFMSVDFGHYLLLASSFPNFHFVFYLFMSVDFGHYLLLADYV